MIQVWVIDNNGYFSGETKFVLKKEKTNLMITEPYTFGYIKGKWDGSEWVEGATEEEIQVWEEENKVVQTPTIEELLIKEIANLKIEIMQLKGGNA